MKILNFLNYNKESFLKFIVVGIGTTLVYVFVFSILWYLLHINQIYCVSCAFISSATFQYLTNKRFTFKVKINDHKYFYKYILLLVINYLVSVSILQFTIKIDSSAILGLILTVLITPVIGYLLFKYWIFKSINKDFR